VSVYIRIALRYLAGYLVLHGVLSQDVADTLAGDPDVAAAAEALVGFAIAAGTEWYYRAAVKYGWPT
jgi:hypothetical protein